MKSKTIYSPLARIVPIFMLPALFAAGAQSGSESVASQATTIRVHVDTVLVDVVVLDDKGKPVPGLKQSDFRIFQDGKEQQVSSFDVVGETMNGSAPSPSLNDIDEGTPRGKVVVLLFDQNTIRSADSKRVLDAAENYVSRHMRPTDLMAVAIHVQSMKIACPLTRDPSKVIEAVRHANAAGTGVPAVGDLTGAKELRSQVTEVFRALKSLCVALEPVRGRKTILLFTEDMEVPTDALGEFKSLVSEARKADVTFFTLDARGSLESSTISASMMDPITQARPSRSTTVNLAQFQNQTTADILRSLASQTDGYPIYNTDNLADALDRIDVELGSYYVLGFQSGNAGSDGKPHKIEVKTDLKDARLKYRDTYTNPHPTDPLAGSKTEDPLRAAIASSTPVTQLPVSFSAGYFYETPQVAQVPIFVKIGRGHITLRKKSGQWTGSASIMGVATAEGGRDESRFSGEINVAIDDAQAAAFRNQDLIYRNFLRLRPGKYRLKLAVMDEKGKIGTAEEGLSIPPCDKDSLTSSSLIITQEMVPLPGLIRELKPQMLSRIDPMQFKGFQIYAPIGADISRQRPMAVFYRLYAGTGGLAGRSFKANVVARNEKGDEHAYPPVDLTNSELLVSQTEAAIGFVLPSGDLAPGKYHLVVKTVEGGSDRSVISEADFQLH